MTKEKEEINYYEILAKLRNYEYKILSINNQEISTWNIDILLLEIKAFIFSHEILKTAFKKRIQDFYNSTKSENYKQRYTYVYNKIKEIVTNKCKTKDRTIIYYEPYQPENCYEPFNAKVTNNTNDTKYFIDAQSEYYYPSLQADTIELTGIFPSEKAFNNFKITTSLESFYSTLDIQTAKIRIDENLFFIPKDLEFYISSGDIKCNGFCESFKLFFYATSICYVLQKLQEHIQGCIYEDEFKNFKNPKIINVENQELTQKEKEVMNNINFTTKEIANKLSISETTVQTHIKNIGEKTGIKGIKKLRNLNKEF